METTPLITDQKKSHEILRIWRLEVILMRLGEEALLEMDMGRCLATLIFLKAKQVESYGGRLPGMHCQLMKRLARMLRLCGEFGGAGGKSNNGTAHLEVLLLLKDGGRETDSRHDIPVVYAG